MGAATYEWTCTGGREAEIILALEKPQGWKASLALHPVDKALHHKKAALMPEVADAGEHHGEA